MSCPADFADTAVYYCKFDNWFVRHDHKALDKHMDKCHPGPDVFADGDCGFLTDAAHLSDREILGLIQTMRAAFPHRFVRTQ